VSYTSSKTTTPMANPEYHRRQAQILTSLSASARDPEIATELLRLAAEHSAWARRGENLVYRDGKPADSDLD
jgi:hypothetical protein